MIFFTWPFSGQCHSVIWLELLVDGGSSPIISLCMAYGHRRINHKWQSVNYCTVLLQHSHRGRGYPPFNITLVLYVFIQQIIHVIVIITRYYIYNINGGVKNFFFKVVIKKLKLYKI